jgi:hypothetical protein
VRAVAGGRWQAATVEDLEHFQKNCSHAAGKLERAVFLGFGFVSAQLQGFTNLRLRQSLAKTQKSSLRIGYSFSLKALDRICKIYRRRGGDRNRQDAKGAEGARMEDGGWRIASGRRSFWQEDENDSSRRRLQKVKIILAIFRQVYIFEIVDSGWLMVKRAAGRGGWPRVAGRDSRAPMGVRCSLTYWS